MLINYKLCLSVAMLILTSSCGNRPETTNFAEKITGLDFCNQDRISNINANSPDRSPGFDFIYIIEITTNKQCLSSVVNQVSGKIHQNCSIVDRCSGNTSEGEFIGIQKVNQTHLILTYSN